MGAKTNLEEKDPSKNLQYTLVHFREQVLI